MSVDDLWYLTKRGPTGERLKSKRYGRGKRWRCRYTDATGQPRTRFFERKADAEDWDARARTGAADEIKVGQSAVRQTFAGYAERWRLSREIGQSLEYRRHTESRLRHHLYPTFGPRQIHAITITGVLEWITCQLQTGVAQSSMSTYFNLLNAVLNGAVADKVIADNPCNAIRLSTILRGLSRAPKWVPNDEQVLALEEAVPEYFRAAIWLGAGEGTRLGEVLGMEAGNRCVDYLRREVHVVQQLRFHKAEYGGFYLVPPKSGSVGDVDLDDHVAAMLAEHIRKFPPVAVDLPDITAGTPDPGKPPRRRRVELLFTDENGRPIHDQKWSNWWKEWRAKAGWPSEGTFHSLRHYFATTLITQGTDPTDVQHALRHSNLRITLETYVHWWPKAERRRNIISAVLRAAADQRERITKTQ